MGAILRVEPRKNRGYLKENRGYIKGSSKERGLDYCYNCIEWEMRGHVLKLSDCNLVKLNPTLLKSDPILRIQVK